MNQALWLALSEEEEAYKRVAGKAERLYVRELKLLKWDTLNEEQQELVRKHAFQSKRVTRARKHLAQAKAWEKKVAEAPAKLEQLKKTVNNAKKLFCMDLEFCEKTKVVTEVGVTVFENGEMKDYHFVVQEFYNRRNKYHVPDHKDNFEFGTSAVMSMDEVEVAVLELVKNSTYLVGHAFVNDKMFLTQCGYFKNTKVLDTQSLSQVYFLEEQQMSLERVTKGLGYNPKFLHNAGNDSHWTMKSLLKMAS